MKFANILKEKKTSIIGLLIAFTTMAKGFGWIPAEAAGGIAVFIPELINIIIVGVLALSKDGK